MRAPRNESKLKNKIRTFFLIHTPLPYKTLSGNLLSNDAVRILICLIYSLDDMFRDRQDITTYHLDAYLGKDKAFPPMDHWEMYEALVYMQQIGLVRNLCGTTNSFFFQATYEAMNYFQLRRKQYIYIFLNSVFLPIVISALTALIVLRING